MSNVGKRLAGGEKKSKPPRKGKLTRQQIILIVVVVALAVALAVTLAFRSLFVRPDLPTRNDSKNTADTDGDGQPDGPEPIDYGDGIRPRGGDGERKSKDYWTILILGLDTGGGGHTDTILLASYDVTNQKATVMSIPRDTMVNVPWDVKKINSVYLHYGGGEKGIQHLYKEIAQLVGFEPDFQVVVEWDAVGKLVDAIGGVYFDVPYEMDYHDPYQDLVIRQAKGYRLLSGDDAMQVIRWRKNDKTSPYGYHTGIGDDGRMQLQQDFLKEVIRQMLTIQNTGNIMKIAKVFDECVETDLSYQNIFWFGKQAIVGGLKIEDVEMLTMPWKGASAWSPTVGNMQAYVVPIAGQLLDVVNNKLSPFVETFTRRDLDIMSVNADGSISSSTGYVEDKRAALPPPKDEPEEEEPVVDENGNPIDPETGEPIVIDPETGEPITAVDPETGEPLPAGPPDTATGSGESGGGGTNVPAQPEGTTPVSPPNGGTPAPPALETPNTTPDPTPKDPETPTPAEPAPEVPTDPQLPADPGFTLIGPDPTV